MINMIFFLYIYLIAEEEYVSQFKTKQCKEKKIL